MERSIREVLARQDDSAESMRRLVKQSHDDFMTLASHSKAELLEQTARLQEQTSDALATITKFTRDMEEQQERGRLGLEEASKSCLHVLGRCC